MGAANLQLPVIARKIPALVPQEHQIRMCSDDRVKLNLEIITSNQRVLREWIQKKVTFLFGCLEKNDGLCVIKHLCTFMRIILGRKSWLGHSS